RRPHGPENMLEQRAASAEPAAARPKRRITLAVGVAGLFLLAAVGLAAAGVRFAWGHAPANPQDTGAVKTKWTILFRSDDPSLWDTRTKGVAIPLDSAPAKFR